MKSKIHRAVVTSADLDYEGSCGIDRALLDAADLLPGEQIHVVNVTNGSRAITYAIEAGAGEITLNGAMAHLGQAGDIVIIISYAAMTTEDVIGLKPHIVYVDASNRQRMPLPSGGREP